MLEALWAADARERFHLYPFPPSSSPLPLYFGSTRLPSHLAFPPDLPLFTPGAATRTPQVGRPSLFLVSDPPRVLDP
ncbi:hypothetical protein PCANC_06159 [Puccinia coronata f. sp. avenae]|uniref:Uncharacterized protein n=1 Tax=Puccinia coronata f. sp. avenae TaxID=200324 RepID=A0A2N5VTL7_9BASI|nr:hypothetical protein PCANC_06159 [Puccinia coronata f. sp. avenae]